jgi:hypothetical protein
MRTSQSIRSNALCSLIRGEFSTVISNHDRDLLAKRDKRFSILTTFVRRNLLSISKSHMSARSEFKIEGRMLRAAESVRRMRRNISTLCDAFSCIFGEAHALRFTMRSDVQLIEKKGPCSQAKERAGMVGQLLLDHHTGSPYRFESLEHSWKLSGIP